MAFPSVKDFISEEELITANEYSRKAVSIPAIIKENSNFSSALRTRLPILNLMVSCIKQAKISAESVRNNPKSGKKQLSEQERTSLEEYARTLGVSKIGYTKVDRDMIFLDSGILYDNAIVFIIEMRKEAIETAPSKTAIKEIFRTYNELGIIVNKISDYLRKSGYNAMAGPAVGGDVSYVPLAQKAGLGIIGKHGVLISDQNFGPSLRIAAVYTDIENLPISDHNPHMWVKDFCKTCNRCVRVCPANAIYRENIIVNGNPDTQTSIDNTKCAVPFANNYGCTVCIKECTFFNNDYATVKDRFNHRKTD